MGVFERVTGGMEQATSYARQFVASNFDAFRRKASSGITTCAVYPEQCNTVWFKDPFDAYVHVANDRAHTRPENAEFDAWQKRPYQAGGVTVLVYRVQPPCMYPVVISADWLV